MGKKKVLKQTGEEAIKESEKVEAAAAKAGGRTSGKHVVKGAVYIKASFNNTIITVTDAAGNAIAWASAGSLGFSGPKKATPFAASKVVAAIAEKLKKTGLANVDVFVSGVGSGRDSAIRSLANQGFAIATIRDMTPIPHNGPRRPKVRRV
ncbi:MAG: 30S ribosomal protein S11 [Patescibacteria group bacterium]|nr:30S ribosomal protein S11 [Patescibacteria group bacterium]